jgi:hypothetical protein
VTGVRSNPHRRGADEALTGALLELAQLRGRKVFNCAQRKLNRCAARDPDGRGPEGLDGGVNLSRISPGLISIDSGRKATEALSISLTIDCR